MNDYVIYGLIGVLAIAVAGLGIKISANLKGGIKNNLKNVNINGDFTGRDKGGVDSKQDKGL